VVQQKRWLEELSRVAAVNGCLILTTNGLRARTILFPDEQDRLHQDGVLSRDRVEEGKRCFLSHHHPSYVREHLFFWLQICELRAQPPTERIFSRCKKGSVNATSYPALIRKRPYFRRKSAYTAIPPTSTPWRAFAKASRRANVASLRFTQSAPDSRFGINAYLVDH
jgi:hypothetical protein